MSTTTMQRVRERLCADYEAQKEAERRAGVPVGRRLTMERLLERTGLEMDRSTLHRKLYDADSSMTIEEAEAIGRALGRRVTVNIKRAA